MYEYVEFLLLILWGYTPTIQIARSYDKLNFFFIGIFNFLRNC